MSFNEIIEIFSKVSSIFDIGSNDNAKLKNIHFNDYLKDIVNIDNPYLFDRIMKYLEYKEDTSKFYELRKKYIEQVILNKKDIQERWLNEYIIEYFFEDNYVNFLINLLQMVNYQRSSKKDLIKLSNMELYNKFNNIGKISSEEKIQLFKENKDRNLKEMFYDDMRIVKDDAYQTMVDHSIKLNKDNPVYNKALSDKYHTDVYYLDGEEFYAIVRTYRIKRNDLSDNYDNINCNLGRIGYSFSFISNKNIGTLDYTRDGVTLMYGDINYKNISYVHHSDMHTGYKYKQESFISNKINEIKTPQDLIARTNGYNEIYINGSNIRPTALICYDEITDNDIAFANKYQLSILLINSSKYKRRDAEYEDYFDNSYSI